jgi:hypothetical protein
LRTWSCARRTARAAHRWRAWGQPAELEPCYHLLLVSETVGCREVRWGIAHLELRAAHSTRRAQVAGVGTASSASTRENASSCCATTRLAASVHTPHPAESCVHTARLLLKNPHARTYRYTMVHHYRYAHVHHFRYAHVDESTPTAPHCL